MRPIFWQSFAKLLASNRLLKKDFEQPFSWS